MRRPNKEISMNTVSASPADPRILVWDAPVRVFHWLLALSFAGAWLTAESEAWRLVHVTLGYTVAGLVVFRILWGLLGTRYARFSAFVRGPRAVARYVGSLAQGRPEHHTGHNPAGALAIVALLSLAALVAATGWATYNELAGEWLGELHEAVASAMLAIVGVHVAGVVLGSWLHRENLVGSMLTGRKSGAPAEGIRSSWRTLAAAMLLAVLGFWWFQWQGAPRSALPADRPAATAKAQAPADDD
jgi:cytochrome b